jgi:nucleotide-binding universal stress UspA family protein
VPILAVPTVADPWGTFDPGQARPRVRTIVWEVLEMIQRILVPTDGSERSLIALGTAARLATPLGVEVDVVSAVAAHRKQHREATIREAIADLGAPVGSVSVVESDDPVDVVGTHLDSAPGALVVMSTHGYTAAEAVLLGSVAERLIRIIERPVLLVGPRCEHPDPTDGPILVATDGSRRSETVLAPVAELITALPTAPKVWAVAVSSPAGFSSASQLPADDIDEAGAAHRCADRLRDAIGQGVEWEVLHGSKPAVALAELAAEVSAGLIAMTTHGRSGLARLTLGSVTMNTVRHAPCPVLVVRPGDLRTVG